MNISWLNERIVSVLICIAETMKKHSSHELDQMLFDSLRIYSSAFQATPNVQGVLLGEDRPISEEGLDQVLNQALLSMDRPAREENLEQVRKAMMLIKAHPDNLISILENFSSLEAQ